jgi:A/G-specific adenine glycosylase
MSNPEIPAFSPAACLLEWYDRVKRPLPWRLEPGLYATVVSEFMLQQTQVKTVLPYYERWMARFPGFQSLAAASADEVMRHWAGLGYYRRARQLHALAIAWCAAAVKPTRSDEWMDFSGVGPYMAAAVASMVFGEKVAVVDGNVIRVLLRMQGETKLFSGAAAAVAAVGPLARQWLDHERPGDYNQAIMELGALVCRPDWPDCPSCPWRDGCGARKLGLVAKIPAFRKTEVKRVERFRLLVLSADRDRVLLSTSAQKGRLEGLLELPLWAGEQAPQAALAGVIRRAIGNERIVERVFRVEESVLTETEKAKSVWISLNDLAELPLSGPHRKWLTALRASGEGSC